MQIPGWALADPLAPGDHLWHWRRPLGCQCSGDSWWMNSICTTQSRTESCGRVLCRLHPVLGEWLLPQCHVRWACIAASVRPTVASAGASWWSASHSPSWRRDRSGGSSANWAANLSPCHAKELYSIPHSLNPHQYLSKSSQFHQITLFFKLSIAPSNCFFTSFIY